MFPTRTALAIVVGLLVILVAVLGFLAWRFTQPSPTVPLTPQVRSFMTITSPSFKNDETVPSNYTCDGVNVNPELHVADVPPGTKSLALIVDDPDAPASPKTASRGGPGSTWTHWTLWNIDPATTVIPESGKPPQAMEGRTSFGTSGYGGPCPPAGKPHHYHFKLFALDVMLDLPAGADVHALETAIDGHLISTAELIGLYSR